MTERNHSMRAWSMIGAIGLVVVAGCSPETVASTSTTADLTSSTTSTTSTTTAEQTTTTTTTTPTSTSTSTPAAVEEWIIDEATETMPPGWDLAFVIPYGKDEELLGTAPGGENLMLGPDYGAQAPDGTWWILDGAKKRVAHYDGDGGYLNEVVLPPELLSSGIYFQFQLPHVLADGRLIATRFEGETTQLLTIVADEPGVSSVDGIFLVRTDDGTLLYGFDIDGAVENLDPSIPTVEAADWFFTQSGDRYLLGASGDGVTIELPDVGISTTIPLSSPVGEGAIHPSIEVGTGADGVLHLFVLGISESDETVQLAGYASIAADGTVSPMEPMIDPFTPADPGSPSHLGVAYGSTTPWVMIVGEDGLEVYLRG